MSQAEHHITSIKTLAIVFGALVFLTIITIIVAQVDLGMMNVPIALAIAIAKGTLVVLIFMGLLWDNKINGVIFAVAIIFLLVFLSLTLFDTVFRGDLSNTSKGTIMEMEAARETP